MSTYSIFLALIVLTTPLMVFPASGVEPKDHPELHPIGFHRGILPTPAAGEDLADTYKEASSYTQFVPVWGRPTPFYDLPSDLGGSWGDLYVEDLIRGNGMFPLIHVNFHGQGMSLISPPGISSPSLSDPEWRGEYRKAALDVVNASSPKYLSLGNEVNRWYEKYGDDPMDDHAFRHWVSLYEEIYDDVKALSPNTTVFCTFAREIVSENREANLSLMSMFDPDKLDIVVLTSYPHSVMGINSLSDIPDDYYSGAHDLIAMKPMGFSEIAWPSFSAFGGEAAQSSFIVDAVNRLTRDQGLELELIGWSWLTDLASDDRIGLRYMDGSEKSGLDTWRMNEAPYYVPENREIRLMEDFGEHRFDLNNVFRDPDDWDHLTFEIRNETGNWSLEKNITLLKAIIDNETLVLLSKQDMNGAAQLMIRAIDHDGLSVWTLVQIIVDPVNDPPRLIVPLKNMTLLEDRSSFIDLSFYVDDPDDAFEELEISVLGSPDLVATVSNPYLIVFPREKDWHGSTWVTISITDPEPLTLFLNMTFIVEPVNDPPFIDFPDVIEMDEDSFLEFDLLDHGGDVDSTEIVWNVTVIEGEVQATIAGALLRIGSAKDWSGIGRIRLDLSDGELNVSHECLVKVSPVNDPPQLGNPNTTIVMLEDQVLYFDLLSLEPFDPEGTSLSWYVLEVSEMFRSVSVLDNDTLRIAPMPDAFGYSNISTLLKDSSGGETLVVFEVTILPVNDPPHISIREDHRFTVHEGGFLIIDLEEYPFIIYDVESPNEDLSIVTDCPYCTVDGLTLNVSMPLGTVIDEMVIEFSLKDPEGALSDAIALEVRVIAINDTIVYRLKVSGIEYENTDGMLSITVRGDPYQVMWVVLSDGRSLKMSEDPPGNGKYVLVLEDPGWAQGERISFHISARDKGPNDTQWHSFSFSYVPKDEVKEEGPVAVWIYLLMAILFLFLLIAMAFLLTRKKRRDLYEE